MHDEGKQAPEDAGWALDTVSDLLEADVEQGLLSEQESGTIRRWLRRQQRYLAAKTEEADQDGGRRRR